MIELLSFDFVNDVGCNIHDASQPTGFVFAFEDRIVFCELEPRSTQNCFFEPLMLAQFKSIQSDFAL